MGRQTRGEDARARDEYETRGRKNYFHAGAFAAASRRVTGVRSVDASPVERSRDSTDRESSTSPTRDASGMDGRTRGRSFATTRARRRRARTRRATRRAITKLNHTDRVVSRVIARRVRRRSTDPSIHPRAFARPRRRSSGPPARRLIFHVQTARHTRAGSRSTPTSGPAGHHPTILTM